MRLRAVSLGLVFALAGLAGAQAPRALTIPDILAWKGIAGEAISHDGAWFAYRETSPEGDGRVVFRQTRGEKSYRFNIGEIPPPAGYGMPGDRGTGAVELSSDGKYGAFLAHPTQAETARLKKQHKPLELHAGVVDLATGTVAEMARVRRIEFSGENPRWIALEKLPPAGERAAGGGGRGAAAAPEAGEKPEADPEGSDLILRELATGLETNLGRVGEFAFDRQGRYLAYTVAAEDRSGNGVVVRDLDAGTSRTLDSDNHAVYRGLHWNHDGDALAFLKGHDVETSLDKAYEVIGFRGIGGSGTPTRVEFDPAQGHGLPAGMSVSPNRAPEWGENGDALFFGLRTLRNKPPKNEDADDAVDLILWNYQDPRLQSEQIVEEGRDRNYSALAEYRLADHSFHTLADDTLRDVTRAPHDRYAIGLRNEPYQLQGHLDGQTYADILVIDLATGQQKVAVPKARWGEETAPDGVHFAFFRDGNYWVYDMATGAEVNATAKAATSFVNVEDDHNVDHPPVPLVGWTRDSRDMILSDGWDLWKVPVDGGAAVNLTVDGKRDQIRYRRPVNFDAIADPTLRGFDLSKPVYLDAYGEWTKKDGIAVLETGQAGARRLMFDDAAYGGLGKARNADVYIFTRESYNAPPDYYVAGPGLAGAARLTDLKAQMPRFLWSSGTVLVNYTGYKGDKLQAALHLPPNYVKGTKVPMVVEFYEKMSQNAYQFIRPTANGFSISYYNSLGYAVLDPDITYKLNEPGMSAAGCLVSAVEAAVATGIPDPKHIGIHGHSWGGYQTAFTITQTHLFAAAMAGAPLTDMISMYGVIYKNSGVTNGEIFEASQGRFTGPPWELWEAYTRNSPVAQVANVTTPLLMLSDRNDGAVDFTQGMEYFNALRRMHKPVVLLDYPSQNHSLSKRSDQIDYTVRMRQFFDHYLKGGPMPAWYAKGVPALGMAGYLRTFEKEHDK